MYNFYNNVMSNNREHVFLGILICPLFAEYHRIVLFRICHHGWRRGRKTAPINYPQQES